MPAVELPPAVWGRMASVAEDRGVTISDLLVSAVHDILKPRSRRERVLHALRMGLTDAVAAERTGELKNYVANVRRDAGLPPNKQHRRTTAPNPKGTP